MEENKYKHIFDFFDDNGRYIGGAEPVTDSTERPALKHSFHAPTFVVYLGWCNEHDLIYSGCCFIDNVERDNKTLQLKPITVKYLPYTDMPLEVAKSSKSDRPTYEDDCCFRAVTPCDKYLRLKRERIEQFESEWKKVVDDKEYFREKYYREDKI